jgi:hypothetical protein
MALNLVKLCVGIAAVEELQASLDRRMDMRQSRGEKLQSFHTTRMVPKRREELLGGGSLYWVIKGKVQVRQILEDIEIFTDNEGIRRCKLLMEPRLILTHWQPRRAFQGWRYLEQKDVPADLRVNDGQSIPPHLQRELAELGLL